MPHSKDGQIAQFLAAEVGKALAHPLRLALLSCLAQGPRPVEVLVRETNQPFANVSQHLQVLKRSGLATTARDGQHIVYALSGDDIVGLINALLDTTARHVAQAKLAFDSMLENRAELNAIDAEDLARRLQEGEVTIIDVRSEYDFHSGHIPGAINIPFPNIQSRLGELPRDIPVVAYCRGAYCICSDEAVRQLTANGLTAFRLEVGLPEWRAEGRPITEGSIR